MDSARKYLKRIVPILILIAGVILAFRVFISDNTERIAEQNEEYLDELTAQRAVSIDNLLQENLSFIRSTAYLYGKSLTSPWADVAVIREYEENTVFDMLRFVDASGDNYTSRGVQSNLADREYFQAGMRGESGITYVLESRVTGEKQIGFYAPVYYDGEIIGVMVGFYGEDYVRKLLEFELFGSTGEGWLCTKDGTVLGTTTYEDAANYFTYLEEVEKCSAQELEEARRAVREDGQTDFSYLKGDVSTSGCSVSLEQADWVLIRQFPPAASRQILDKANAEGRHLVYVLFVLFFAVAAYFVIDTLLQLRKEKEANKNAHDVSSGVTTLFRKFITYDLQQDEYRYIVGLPDDSELQVAGSYAAFSSSLLARIPNTEQREEARDLITLENLKEQLKHSDRFSVRVHAPTSYGEWFTYNYIVIERDSITEEPVRLLIISQDVTKLREKELEEQERLEEALTAAENASRAKTEFLFNMSHDIRTPMNAIIGYTELAQREGITEEELRDFIRKIDSSSVHLLDLINDMLEMSRIESGKITLEAEETDLTRVMRETKELFDNQMSGKEIAFSVDVSGVRHPLVLCDEKRLNRITLNLISNAFKFTPEGGSVQVILEEASEAELSSGDDGGTPGTGCYRLHVKDSGIGMSEEFVKKLFTPFERERTSTVSRVQGTGLGLSITKKLTDLMGGEIRVLTEQGKGTEFIVTLHFPLAERHAAVRKDDGRETAVLDFSRLHLLLVDDMEVNREIALMMLTTTGCRVDVATDGQEAVEIVKASAPGEYDAVLMDIQMPVMDGYTAARTIRALPDPRLAQIPIIAMTANAFKEDVQNALDAGMNGHIAKPLMMDVVIRTLTEVLGSGSAAP